MWMRRARSIFLVFMLLALTNTYALAQSGVDSHLADGIVVKSIRGDVSYLHNRPSVERLADHYSFLYSAKAGYGDPAAVELVNRLTTQIMQSSVVPGARSPEYPLVARIEVTRDGRTKTLSSDGCTAQEVDTKVVYKLPEDIQELIAFVSTGRSQIFKHCK